MAKGGDCWLWTGRLRKDGYANFSFEGRHVLAHRFAYELEIGPIPDGLTLDHLCRVRHCVRPDHLEPVTQAENVKRGQTGWHNKLKTHCKNGHPFNETNTTIPPDGYRRCRLCKKLQMRGYRAAKRG